MRKSFGALLMVVGLVGVLVGPLVALSLRGAVKDLAATATAGIEVGSTGLGALRETVSAATATLDSAALSMDDVASVVLVAGASIEDSRGVLEQVAAVSGEELPEAIDSVRGSMPALVKVADAIDSTLRAVAFLTPSGYDPEVPFGESIQAIDQSLAAMRPSLVAQGDLIAEAVAGFDGVVDEFNTAGSGINELRDSLQQGAIVLDGNTDTLDEAQELFDSIESDLTKQVSTLSWVLIAGGVIFALSQLATLTVGAAIYRGELFSGDSRSN